MLAAAAASVKKLHAFPIVIQTGGVTDIKGPGLRNSERLLRSEPERLPGP